MEDATQSARVRESHIERFDSKVSKFTDWIFERWPPRVSLVAGGLLTMGSLLFQVTAGFISSSGVTGYDLIVDPHGFWPGVLTIIPETATPLYVFGFALALAAILIFLATMFRVQWILGEKRMRILRVASVTTFFLLAESVASVRRRRRNRPQPRDLQERSRIL